MHDSQSILRPLNVSRTSTAASSRRLRPQHVIRICVLRRTKPQQGTSSSPSKSRLFPMRIPLHAAGSAVHVSTTTVACLQRNYTRGRLSHTTRGFGFGNLAFVAGRSVPVVSNSSIFAVAQKQQSMLMQSSLVAPRQSFSALGRNPSSPDRRACYTPCSRDKPTLPSIL
jgi:hypothetical protein